MKWMHLGLSLLGAGLLSACGGDDYVTGSIVNPPAVTASFSPTELQAAFVENGTDSLFQVTGQPKCNVNFHSYKFSTYGAASEKTTSGAAVITPSGDDPACTGERPVLLYAHGTSLDKNSDMALLSNSEAALVAATYVAQGYIVVAPNYAGYAGSSLSYHPYLMMNQQASEMVDAWNAVKGQLPSGASANGKLFVAGYSQGGHVAMATQRALQLAGTPVTAAAPMSGPYALGTFMDAVIAGGNVNAGATLFAPLLLTAAQKTYGNMYTTPDEVYESAYVTGIESLLPSTTPLNTLLSEGKLPLSNLFAADSQPQSASGFGFGAGHLLKTSFRNAYIADAVSNPTAPKHPVRTAVYKNDLLKQDWTPNRPMLLCGGQGDPTVFFSVNTTVAKTYFDGKGANALVTTLDVDSAPSGASDPFAAVKMGFAQTKSAYSAADVLAKYHGELVPPFCQVAARGFFSQF